MNDADIFSTMGRQFRSREELDSAARNVAMDRLPGILTLCKDGIAKFYEAARLGKPDVYAEKVNDRQVRIWYGMRPAPGADLTGPSAMVVVEHDGKITLCSDIRWKEKGQPDSMAKFQELPKDGWLEAISFWLAKFLSDAERLYRGGKIEG